MAITKCSGKYYSMKGSAKSFPFPLPDSPLPSPPGVTCWRRLDHRANLLHQPLQATFHPWQAQHAPKVALCSSRSASAQNPAPLSWRPPPPVRRIRPRFRREHVTPQRQGGESEGHWLLVETWDPAQIFLRWQSVSPCLSHVVLTQTHHLPKQVARHKSCTKKLR